MLPMNTRSLPESLSAETYGWSTLNLEDRMVIGRGDRKFDVRRMLYSPLGAARMPA